ncbi:LamG domain-containing protein [Novipirellula artificiosorum]|nr:LamG domain-containing protein [Novipirellula artificiosorum]
MFRLFQKQITPFPWIRRSQAACLSLFYFTLTISATAPVQSQWYRGYDGDDATADSVLGLWKFDGDQQSFAKDSSSHQHSAVLRGGEFNANGRFGGCLESHAGYPIVDESHGIHVQSSPVLSPTVPFSVEMWVKPKSEDEFLAKLRPVLLDSKYIPGNPTGMKFGLTNAKDDGRRMSVEIGLGERSETWYSPPLLFAADRWQHIAFHYDARGVVSFFVDGSQVGQVVKPGAGSMAVSQRPLSIGDRIGSLYSGFPGLIDEVRITSGTVEFRPFAFQTDSARLVFLRMDSDAHFSGHIENFMPADLTDSSVEIQFPNGKVETIKLPVIASGQKHPIEVPVDCSLRPGRYEVAVTMVGKKQDGGNTEYRTTTIFPLTIVRRPLPDRMPVVMWGVNGTDNVVQSIPALKNIGFTHCLGLRADYQKIWNEGSDALPGTAAQIQADREMLDVALENEIGVIATLAPARWLRTSPAGETLLRMDRNGKPYDREDVSALLEPVQKFCFDTGAAIGRAYGDHPAFEAALLHTEVRSESQVSFRKEEVAAYLSATGKSIPSEVTSKNGVDYKKISDFPEDRVIDDEDPILMYLKWFWREGDGWNRANSKLNDGLKQNIERDGFWTFHDPAIRVPSVSGSGGDVDVLSHWTYSYPDPVRIGLCTDELLEMSRVGGRSQDVMKMTQLIWYRSQTAPPDVSPRGTSSPWVDQDPAAAYITIAPMHLREALWWKLSRPIKGIMYHGWQSLLDVDSGSSYRYTNPATQHELKRLIESVVEPLGPTLTQIPDVNTDVVFLESFTSQMFARRGTYGWNNGWAGDLYHVLMYAQLQPRVMYEESLLAGGLDTAKVLVLADCDVLTESVVEKIHAFQQRGGLIVGDKQVCPAIRLDWMVPRFERKKQAKADRDRVQDAAAKLRKWLDSRYVRQVDSTNPDVVTRCRRYQSTDYVFAVNDHREPGTYVGGFGLVMEDGLPSDTKVSLLKSSGHVYDLCDQREVFWEKSGERLTGGVSLGPCEGRVWMVTEKPIRRVDISLEESAHLGERMDARISITDGETPMDAVIPVQVQISDPEGMEAEFSGYYGAAGGELSVPIEFAANDHLGLWTVKVTELASGKSSSKYVRLGP